jgi:hypothetical protein
MGEAGTNYRHSGTEHCDSRLENRVELVQSNNCKYVSIWL